MTPALRFLAPLLAVAVCAAPALAEPRVIAVLPVAGEGVAEADLSHIVNTLHEELRRLPGVQLRPLEGSGTMGGMSTCLHDDLTCLTALGTHLGTSHVVAGFVSRRGDGFGVQLNAVDTRAEAKASSVDFALGANNRTWGAKVREEVTRLMTPARLTGVLVVSVTPPGATVLLDGVARGVAPLSEPIAGLTPGQHQLEVRLAGHSPVRRFVQVDFSKVTSVRVTLTAEQAVIEELVTVPVEAGERASAPNAALSTGGAATAGLGVVLAVAGGAAITYASIALSAVPNNDPTRVAAQLEELELWSGVGYGLGATGVLVSLIGAGMFAASYVVE